MKFCKVSRVENWESWFACYLCSEQRYIIKRRLLLNRSYGLNDHPCERPCAPLPRARMWKCVPGRFAAIRTIIVNVCGSRVRELTPTRSRLSIIVEGGNTCQQCRTTMGIPWPELRTISTLLAFVGFPRIHGAMFSKKMLQRRISFLLAAVAMSLFTNLLEITFVFSPLLFLSFFFSALFIPLRAQVKESLSLYLFLFLVIFCFPYRVIKFVQTRIASETWKIKFLHSRRENLICLCDRREIGVEKTIVCSASQFV